MEEDLESTYQEAYQEAYGRPSTVDTSGWTEEQYEAAMDYLSWMTFLDRNGSQ